MSHRHLEGSMSEDGDSIRGWQAVTITEGIINSKFGRNEAIGESHLGNEDGNNYSSTPKGSMSAANGSVPSVTGGLSSEPHLHHARHLNSTGHLAEVQELHTRFLVSSGEIAESHLAEILPERRLKWMVDEIGGILGNRGISIPLRGTTLGRVEVSKGEMHGHPAMKLNLLDIDWKQTVTLPDDAGELTAVWDSGDLHISW